MYEKVTLRLFIRINRFQNVLFNKFKMTANRKNPYFYTRYALLLTLKSKKPYNFRNSFWKQHWNFLQSMNWLCIGKLSLSYSPMSDARSQLARSAACLGVCQTELWCGRRRGNKSVLKWGNTYYIAGTKNIKWIITSNKVWK